MIYSIKQDEAEFKDIVRRKIRKDLFKYIEKGRIRILGPGQGAIVPIEEIEIPQLSFGPIVSPNETVEEGDEDEAEEEGNGDKEGSGDNSVHNQSDDVGIGEGDGDPGTDLGPVPKKQKGKKGGRHAGQGRGADEFWMWMPDEDIRDLLMEALQLPRIKPKGDKTVRTEEDIHNDTYHAGPESSLIKKPTLLRAIKRLVAQGVLDADNIDPEKVVIIPDDKRYLVSRTEIKPRSSAVIFFMMDVSGSVLEEERKIIRYFCELFELWIHANYDGVEARFIIHDGEASEVSREEFHGTQRAGGTVISSAHELMLKIIYEKFPPERWNIYPLYFSDGFNWGGDDQKCLELLRDKILPIVNQYTYGEIQTQRWWGFDEPEDEIEEKVAEKFSPSGSFGLMLADQFEDNELVVGVNLYDMEDVPDAIKRAFEHGH